MTFQENKLVKLLNGSTTVHAHTLRSYDKLINRHARRAHAPACYVVMRAADCMM